MTNNLPNNLLYNQDYSWARIENDTAVLGIIKPDADKVKEFVLIVNKIFNTLTL